MKTLLLCLSLMIPVIAFTQSPPPPIVIHQPQHYGHGGDGLKVDRASSFSDSGRCSIALEDDAITLFRSKKQSDGHLKVQSFVFLDRDELAMEQVLKTCVKWESIVRKTSAVEFKKQVAIFQSYISIPIQFNWDGRNAFVSFDTALFSTADIAEFLKLLAQLPEMRAELISKKEKVKKQDGLFVPPTTASTYSPSPAQSQIPSSTEYDLTTKSGITYKRAKIIQVEIARITIHYSDGVIAIDSSDLPEWLYKQCYTTTSQPMPSSAPSQSSQSVVDYVPSPETNTPASSIPQISPTPSYSSGGGGTYVNGYYRKNGTYVHGYYRSR